MKSLNRFINDFNENQVHISLFKKCNKYTKRTNTDKKFDFRLRKTAFEAVRIKINTLQTLGLFNAALIQHQ